MNLLERLLLHRFDHWLDYDREEQLLLAKRRVEKQVQAEAAAEGGAAHVEKDTSLDDGEDDTFEATSDEWWAPYGEFLGLHMLGPFRLHWLYQQVRRHFGMRDLCAEWRRDERLLRLYEQDEANNTGVVRALCRPNLAPGVPGGALRLDDYKLYYFLFMWKGHASETPRSSFFNAFAERVFEKPVSVLDIGCGGGLISIPLASMGLTVTCSDVNDGFGAVRERLDNVPSVKERIQGRLSFAHNSIGGLVRQREASLSSSGDPHAGKYDVITCLEVIEHVNLGYQGPFVQDLLSMLRPGGVLLLATQTRSLRSVFEWVWFFELFMRVVPRGTHNFRKFVRVDELEEMVASYTPDWAQPQGDAAASRVAPFRLSHVEWMYPVPTLRKFVFAPGGPATHFFAVISAE